MTQQDKNQLRNDIAYFLTESGVIELCMSKRECEYLLKALEAFEQPLPLDAGEWFNESSFVTSEFLETGEGTLWLNTQVLFECMIAFAQASITAKQREWDKEKAELVDAAKVAYELVPGFLRDSSLVKKVKMTISKYTNQ